MPSIKLPLHLATSRLSPNLLRQDAKNTWTECIGVIQILNAPSISNPCKYTFENILKKVT